jgi:hypothetical protein
MSNSFDEPSDENEAFENLDESLDDEEAVRGDTGVEPSRDLDTDLVVDQEELEEIGANLDDPEQMSMLDGGMDDPDGAGPSSARSSRADEAGWDVDPVARDSGGGAQSEAGADGDATGDTLLDDVPDVTGDPDLEEIDTDPADFDEIADDSPGPDSARW